MNVECNIKRLSGLRNLGGPVKVGRTMGDSKLSLNLERQNIYGDHKEGSFYFTSVNPYNRDILIIFKQYNVYCWLFYRKYKVFSYL